MTGFVLMCAYVASQGGMVTVPAESLKQIPENPELVFEYDVDTFSYKVVVQDAKRFDRMFYPEEMPK